MRFINPRRIRAKEELYKEYCTKNIVQRILCKECCTKNRKRAEESVNEKAMEKRNHIGDEVKDRIARYWSLRAEGFETQRLREYESEKRARWLAEFRKYLPDGRGLRILDVGTGTGFFACILTAEGHRVTGIDLTADMIAHARHMASALGLDVCFQVMDAEKTDFPQESFDAVVTRNLTWTLPHVAEAYREWFRILKPGGLLINFDADYFAALGEEENVILPENHAHKLVPESLRTENDAITRAVGAVQKPRPQWDYQLLTDAGFEWICIDRGVYRRIYKEIDEFYNPVPIFLIAARKPEVFGRGPETVSI